MADNVPEKLIFGTIPSESEVKIIEELKKALEETKEYKDVEEEASEYLTQEVYHRFLCSRQYKLDKTLERLRNHLTWRFVTIRPHEIKIDEVKEFNKYGCTQISPRGPDKHGRPIFLLNRFKMNNILQDETKYEEEDIKLLTFAVELTTRYFTTEARRMVVVMNLQQFSLWNTVPRRVTKQIISIFGSQYPETLGLAVIYGAPWAFDKFYKLIKVFIDSGTKKKFFFLPANTKDGSAKDKKMKTFLGDNWRDLIGLGLPKETDNSAEGYDHEKYWARVEEDLTLFLIRLG